MNNNEKELERIKRNFKVYKLTMILIDIIALIILFIQINMKDVAYYSYIILIICNLLIFLIKPSMCIRKDKNKNF